MSVKKIFFILAALGVVACLIIPTKKPSFGDKFKGEVFDSESLGEANIKGVNLYCDFSRSMRGYIDFAGLSEPSAANNVVGNIAELLNKIETKYEVKSSTICGNNKFSKTKFIDALVDKKKFDGKESLIWDLVNDGVKYATDSTVSIVLSDMVLSYGLATIRERGDTDFNMHQINGLTGKITDVMTSAKTKGLEVVVIQYFSDFNGDYYWNYTENIRGKDAYKKQKMEKRPYYVLLLGTKENLADIVNEECYHYDSDMNMYATFVESTPKLKEVPYCVTTGANCWYCDSYDEEDPEILGGFYSAFDDTEPSLFSIECSDFKLPRYYYSNSMSFMAENKYGDVSNIVYDDLNGSLKFIFRANSVESLPKIRGGSCFEMDIYATNRWIEDSQIADNNDVDQDMKSLERKTWGIQALFDGINSVYYGRETIEKSKVASLKVNFYRTNN